MARYGLNEWKWMKMHGMAENGLQLKEMAEKGWKWMEMAGMA